MVLAFKWSALKLTNSHEDASGEFSVFLQSLFSSGWLQAQLNDTHRIYIAKAIFGSERDDNFSSK